MSLAAVDANGVSQRVIDVVEQWRQWRQRSGYRQSDIVDQQDSPSTRCQVYCAMSTHTFSTKKIIAQTTRTMLSLEDGDIWDEAITVFDRFLRERTPCHLHFLPLWRLPPQQIRQLLAALQTNKSVKELYINNLQHDEAASWIADLLRHKKDLTFFELTSCWFPFTQILPLMREQQNLTSL